MSSFKNLLIFSALFIGMIKTQSYVNVDTGTPYYTLQFLREGSRITFQISANTKGYIGFGFSNYTGMIGGDLFVGGCHDNGTGYVGDYTSYRETAREKPSLDEFTQDWDLISASENETWTTVRFSREMITQDFWDIPIEDTLMSVIWSFGRTDELAFHLFNYGYFKYNFIQESNNGETPVPPISTYTTSQATTPIPATTTEIPKACPGYEWSPSNTQLTNPFEFGSDLNSQKAYSCRSPLQGQGLLLGQYTIETGICRVAVQGSEFITEEVVEVLTNPNGGNLHFQPSPTIPFRGALIGGTSADGEPLYVIRCPVTVGGQQGWIAGRYTESDGLGVGSWNGQVVQCLANEIHFLVCD